MSEAEPKTVEGLDWGQLIELLRPTSVPIPSADLNLPTIGLLNGLLPLPPSPEELARQQKIRNDQISSIGKELSNRRAHLPRSVFFGKSFQEEGLEFDERLFDFALARNLNLDGDWRARAIEMAAKEHPFLSSDRKPRGRPKREEPRGLLSLISNSAGPTRDDKLLLNTYERLAKEIKRLGHAPTQRNICKMYLWLRDQHLERQFDPTSDMGRAHIQDLSRKFNAARKRAGVPPLKRGRPSNLSN